jgi:hypothetical protein
MATPEERMKILKMIQEGKITAQEGAELLEALDVQAVRPGSPAPGGPAVPISLREQRWFRVVVTDTTTGKTRVNIRLPVSLVNAGLKMGAKFSPQVDGLDAEKLMTFLRTGETGKVIDVQNDDNSEHVEVYIE